MIDFLGFNMNKEDFKKFKIKIKYKNDVPIYPKNPYIEYEKLPTITKDTLYTEIFYDDVKIGIGMILDFYKKFEIRESDWGNLYTYPLTRTELGNKIYKIKFYKEPSISDVLKNQYINSFVELFEEPLKTLKRKMEGSDQSLCITYIPSSTETPNLLASKLSEELDIQLETLISKNDGLEDSKSIEEYFESMEHSLKKYNFNKTFIEQNKTLRYLVVDDVFGLGSSMLTTMKTFYDITQKINFFFAVVKDTKR